MGEKKEEVEQQKMICIRVCKTVVLLVRLAGCRVVSGDTVCSRGGVGCWGVGVEGTRRETLSDAFPLTTDGAIRR